MGSLRRFFERVQARIAPWRLWSVASTVDAADEIPAEIPKRRAVLVSSGGRFTWIAFDCPCGRGHRVMLNLDPRRRPSWNVQDTVLLTIHPSIDDRTSGRRCHFNLRAGRVRWSRNRRVQK